MLTELEEILGYSEETDDVIFVDLIELIFEEMNE